MRHHRMAFDIRVHQCIPRTGAKLAEMKGGDSLVDLVSKHMDHAVLYLGFGVYWLTLKLKAFHVLVAGF